MHNICLKLLHGENTFDRLEVEPSYRLITGRLGMSYDNDINGSGVLSWLTENYSVLLECASDVLC